MNFSPKQWVLLTALISGVSVYYNSMAVKGVDAIGFAAAKNMLAALVLVGAIALSSRLGELKQLGRSQLLQLLAIAIIGGSIPFALFFGGISMASAGAAGSSFIYRLMFFFSAIMAVVLLRERPSVKTAAGVVLILLANLLYLLSIKSFVFGIGELMVLGATLMWSAETILLKKSLAWISPDALAAVRLGAGSAILFAAIMLFMPASAAAIVSMPLVPLVVSALFILGFTTTFYRGLSGLGVSEATAILTLGGLVSAGLPILLSSRLPGVMESISLVLIAIGVGVVLTSRTIPNKILTRA